MYVCVCVCMYVCIYVDMHRMPCSSCSTSKTYHALDAYSRTRYIHTYIHKYIRVHTRTYIHTYIHTCTYIHTYIHTCTTSEKNSRPSLVRLQAFLRYLYIHVSISVRVSYIHTYIPVSSYGVSESLQCTASATHSRQNLVQL